MSMTHYMGLLMENSPWNLIIFMAVPVILAETIAITELVLLYANKPWSGTAALNRVCSYAAGMVMTGIACYLIFAAVLPLSRSGLWRGPIDLIAVIAYLLSALPLLALAVLNLKQEQEQDALHRRTGLKISCVAAFLIISHVAMIFGMADPALGGFMEEVPMGGHHMMVQESMPHSMGHDHAGHMHH